MEIAPPPKSPTSPSARRPAVPIASTDVAAVRRRQAALQHCGLVPSPRRDLSQLEKELDRRFSHIVALPHDPQDGDELTSAEKIRREWQAKNEAGAETRNQIDGADLSSDSQNSQRLPESDSTGNPDGQKFPELPIVASLSASENSLPLPPIPETFSFPDIPEEDVIPSESNKVFL